jgi:Tfp pilus assembly protein PilF
LAPISVAPTAPASEVQAAPTACGSGLSMAERLACAATDMNADAEPAPPKAAQKTKPISPSAQSWIGKYAAMNGVALGLSATPQSEDTPPSGEDSSMVAALPATPPSGAAETDESAPTITGPGDPPRATAPPPRVNLIRPANAKVTAMIDSGRRAAAKGDLDRAVHDFNEAIRLDPKYPDGYAERGQANFKLGETDRAIADYTAAIQRDPQHGTALRSRGMAYLYRGTSDLALADLTKAIELAENDPTMMSPIELFYARRSRASILGTKQQYDREVEDYSSLIASYMSDPTVVDALKSNYGDVGAANILATVYRQRATAHIRRQSWDLAIADLTAAIPLGSDRGYTALVDRAKIYEGLGKRDQAVADLQDALALRPGAR